MSVTDTQGCVFSLPFNLFFCYGLPSLCILCLSFVCAELPFRRCYSSCTFGAEGHGVPISLPQQLVTERRVTGHLHPACCLHTGALFGTLLFVLHKDQEVCQSEKVSGITRSL